MDGHEENSEPDNLMWTCRSCNVLAANTMRAAGLGRKTRQYNPASEGAKSAGQWLTAVESMKGQSSAMTVADAVEMIHATPAKKRSEFASELFQVRRKKYGPSGRSSGGDMPDWVTNPSIDKAVWQEGFQAGESGKRKCPYPAASAKAYSWHSGFIEGQAKREGYSYSKGKKNPKNPQQAAEDLYESFHGKPPEGVTIVQEEIHEHEHLAPLGVLVNFRVATLTGVDALIGTDDAEAHRQDYDETQANAETIFLAANEEGTQLYFRGGDQSLDLDRLKFKGDWVKDDMIIGILYELTYRTRKKFDKFKLTDYYHNLGEETGDQPMLRYDPDSPHLFVTGGKYKIKMPLIGMSPGIEN